MTPIGVNHMASNNRMVNDELINMEGRRDKALTSA
jgi:hypothetical protein